MDQKKIVLVYIKLIMALTEKEIKYIEDIFKLIV